MSGTDYNRTTNYSLFKPIPTHDVDVWGDHWNTNADTLDAALKTAETAGFGGLGRNYIHNPMFNIAQRGNGPVTASGFTADRWRIFIGGDTVSVTRQAVAPGIVPDEEARFVLTNAFTGDAAAASCDFLIHSIENVSRLSNKTVTVSFYAAAASGAPRLGVSFDQSFGTGGSPSVSVTMNGQSVALTTVWARYSLTFVLPSVAAKVIGTSGTDTTNINFWFSSGTTNAIRSGNVGVQSGVISLWGIQVEAGAVVSPLERVAPRQDLENCQRFYQVGAVNWTGSGIASALVGYLNPFPVTMHHAPTVGLGAAVSEVNISSVNVDLASASGFRAIGQATATAATTLSRPFTANADLF